MKGNAEVEKSRLFSHSCGDLACLLLIKRNPWPCAELKRHQLFKLVVAAAMDLSSVSEHDSIKNVYTIIDDINSSEESQSDGRPLVVELHQLSVKIFRDVSGQQVNVSKDLLRIWKEWAKNDPRCI